MQKRDEYGNIPLHRAFRFDHINVIDAVCKLVGRDAFLDVLQKCNNYGNTPLHDVCCNGQVNVQVNVIDAVYELVGRDAFLALIEERNKHGNTPLHEAALFKKKAIFVWLLERCKGDEDFKLKLRELVQSLKTQLASEDPGTQAAIMELLEFLNSDPDEGCNVSQYSSSDDDDDDAGSGGSNGKNESNRPVIHVDCSHLFNTQENGGDSGGGCDSGSNNQSQESSSSKKAAYSLMSSFKLNPPGVEGDAGIRSVMGY